MEKEKSSFWASYVQKRQNTWKVFYMVKKRRYYQKIVLWVFFFFIFLCTKMLKRFNRTLYGKREHYKKNSFFCGFLIVRYQNAKVHAKVLFIRTRKDITRNLSFHFFFSVLSNKTLKCIEGNLYWNTNNSTKNVSFKFFEILTN